MDLVQLYENARRRCGAPQLAYAVIERGRVVASADTRTAFRIASMTKSFTAAAVLQLRDDGRLDLDTPVADLLPEAASIRHPDTDAPAVTLRHLMTMSSGLPRDDPWGDRLLDISPEQFDRILARGATFAAPVGARYIYSNLGYALLGRVITRVAGRPFQRVITERLLAPLGLTATGWTAPAGHAVPHRRRRGRTVSDTAPLGDGEFAAMGGLWSTVDDITAWSTFLMRALVPGAAEGDGPLSLSSRREMQQIHRSFAAYQLPVSGRRHTFSGGYGMGLRIVRGEGCGEVVNHSGGLPGYGSNMMWRPETETVAVALCNVTYAPMAAANVAVMHQLPPRPLTPAQGLDRAIEAAVGLVNNWEGAAAEAMLADNIGWDEDLSDRGAAIARAIGGAAVRPGRVTLHTGCDASVELEDSRSEVVAVLDLSITPERPPRIQELSVRPRRRRR